MGWLTGWAYRKSVTLTHDSGALTDYQMKLLVGESAGASGCAVHCEGHAKTDFSDLRFAVVDGTTLLDYWIESATGTTPNQLVTIWIEFDSIGTDATTFYMYYGNASVSTDPISAPLTHQWKKYSGNPVLAVGAAGKWDDWWVAIHSIWKEGSTYYAYYNGCKSNTNMQIGLATSTDGITWTRYDVNNPVLAFGAAGKWDDDGVGSPLVWKEGSTWYMLFNGRRSTGNFGIGLATSSDGISWTRYDVDNPVMAVTASAWDSAMLGPGTLMLKEGSTYYLYYMGGTSRTDQTTWKIGLATSADLHTWTKSGNNPLLSPVGSGNEWSISEPCVQKFGSIYYMWYQMTGDDASLNRSRIGIASSSLKDSDWTKGSNNPIHDNSIGAWDSNWTETPVLIQVGTEWRLYCGGSQGSAATPRVQTGYSTYTIDGGQETFPLYDHFDGGRTGEIWTTGGSPSQSGTDLLINAASEIIKSVATFQYKAMRARVKFAPTSEVNAYQLLGFNNYTDGTWTQSLQFSTNDDPNIRSQSGTTSIEVTNLGSTQMGSYAVYEILWKNGEGKYLIDDVLVDTDTTYITATANSVKFMDVTTSSNFIIDWVFVRNYVSPEPVWGSWGGETGQSTSSFFLLF